MMVEGKLWRTIWREANPPAAGIIDQTRLPHAMVTRSLRTLEEAAESIRAMRVRGAPLIGATAAYGLWLAMRDDTSDAALERAIAVLLATRPTAVNLRWALARGREDLKPRKPEERVAAALALADRIAEEDVTLNRAIGEAGLPLMRSIAARKGPGEPVRVLTHCNAGWLATVDWGTATAPLYRAAEEGIPLHVWVDETRPRNQGSSLTAWELRQQGIAHTVIVDNAGGHLMQRGEVDLVLVGTDRTTSTGDVCNKIGTYLKALAAHDNGIPFHVALPSPTIDWEASDGLREIPIEERDPEEVTHLAGRLEDGSIARVSLTPPGTSAANPAFDITPARLVTGLITERGVCAASAEGLQGLFPERSS
jgi:methylthioribose-1-phosphate isomerase